LPEEPLPKKRKTAKTTKHCNTNQEYLQEKEQVKLELLKISIYKKKLEAFKLEQDLGLGPSKFTDDVLKFE
jgi:hypothetical protein